MNGIGVYGKTSYVTAGETYKEYLHEKSLAGRNAPAEKTALKNATMRSRLRQLNGTDPSAGKKNNTLADSVLNNMQGYSHKLRADRKKSNETANGLKKLKYSFKNISSRIIGSKTSAAAKQAVSQAKREVMRLMKEKKKGGYDPEEIEAAIAHAKAMERVARKKERHLEEEEMAAAARRGKRDPLTDEKYEDKYDEKCEEDEDFEDYGDDVEDPEELREYEEELLEYDDSELSDASFEDELSFINGMGETVRDLSEELVDEIEALLEEIGLDDLTDSLLSVDTDMDAADLKELKMKHRNKEMKEMVEADAKYLKAVFEHLAKLKAGGSGIPGMSDSKSAMPSEISFSANPGVSAAAVAAFTPAPEASAPVIDIAL